MFMGAETSPISKLIARIIADSGLSRTDFVQRLDYRNSAKGLRRLDRWLADGDGDADCLRKIVDAFHPDPAELKSALAETEALRQHERRGAVAEIEERERRFKPFIWIETEDGAHSFLTAIAERQVKVLWMRDGFEGLSESARLEAAKARVRKHHAATKGYPGFGKILQYRYADTFDSSIVLNVEGDIIEATGGRFLLPEVWMALHP